MECLAMEKKSVVEALASLGISAARAEACFSHCLVFPGFVDVHVHLREPGFFYKETIASGTAAGAKGGYTALCAMPNLNPVPDSRDTLFLQLELIRQKARIPVYPYGAISMGEQGQMLSDMEAMAPYVIGFSDDGKGVQKEGLMAKAMEKAQALGKIIAAHCEEESLLNGGYIHDGAYAKAHGHKGICKESEWQPLARDLRLAKETGCAYHVCHVSCLESVELIRQAKKEGVDVTCETAPHYLTLTEADLEEDGRFKMNPPLRTEEDRKALIQGILDGTVDMIATDHAPHSREEKSRGLKDSLMGVVGLETAFPVLYTKLVCPGILPLETLIRCLSTNPRKRFSIPLDQDMTIWDLTETEQIDPETFLSQGRSTPFAQWEVKGKCKMTIAGGRIVWQDDLIESLC